jgi:hypothetical protein
MTPLAICLELARLRAVCALLATRMPGLSDADGRILVDLLTPPPPDPVTPKGPTDARRDHDDHEKTDDADGRS